MHREVAGTDERVRAIPGVRDRRVRATKVRLYLSYDIKITLKSHFWHKKVRMLSFKQHCYGHHFITLPKSLNQTTSGLLILMHDIISLPDATSYDKIIYNPQK